MPSTSWPDLINASFEAVGGMMVWMNVRAIMRDRIVRGVSEASTWAWSLWGLWNLYYYPALGQWMSLAGAGVIVSGNVAWCVCAWRFRNS